MPTYQYACTECGEPLEAVQKFTDDPLTVCPACGGKLRKVFSPVGIVFKGSGFYRNDSRVSAANGSKDKQPNGSSAGSSGARARSLPGLTRRRLRPAQARRPGETKPDKKTGSASSGKSSATGTKVA